MYLVDGLNNPWELIFGPDDGICILQKEMGVYGRLTESGEAKVIQTFPEEWFH